MALASGVLAAALLLAACGGGYASTTSDSSGASAEKTQNANANGSRTVQTGKISAGNVLVNSEGMTLTPSRRTHPASPPAPEPARRTGRRLRPPAR